MKRSAVFNEGRVQRGKYSFNYVLLNGLFCTRWQFYSLRATAPADLSRLARSRREVILVIIVLTTRRQTILTRAGPGDSDRPARASAAGCV